LSKAHLFEGRSRRAKTEQDLNAILDGTARQ
jgi:hypothetical protein